VKRLPLLFIVFVGLCIPAKAQHHTDWSYNLSLYEVNTRQYTPEGTFNAFSEYLDTLQAMEAGILWFMPIHPIGQQNRLGSLGSYYSVQNYLEVNPNHGTFNDFKNLVTEIHERDMYVIIDWVANHTSWDNVLTEEHPEWYVTSDNGDFIPPPGTNWSDVIELDYSKQGLREYMIDALKFWVDSAGVDGFRFDAVDYVPDDFWSQAIDSLKSHKPDIFLLAESDNTKWHDLGFDMTYGWGLYGFESGVLHDIAAGNGTGEDVKNYALRENGLYNEGEYRTYFTQNHDVNSWEGTEESLFGDAAELFTVLTATFKGMPLIYSGQEAGLDVQLPFFEKASIDWSNYEDFEFFQTLLKLKKENSALWNGSSFANFTQILSTNNTDIFAFTRHSGDDKILVIMNFSNRTKSFFFSGDDYKDTYKNVFTGEELDLTSSVEIELKAWDYMLLEQAELTTSTEIDDIPAEFELRQNYPNPFNPTTSIEFSIPSTANVELNVYSSAGVLVSQLVDGVTPAGTYQKQLDASQLASGIYFYELIVNGQSMVRKMALIK
jgi:glycosidase